MDNQNNSSSQNNQGYNNNNNNNNNNNAGGFNQSGFSSSIQPNPFGSQQSGSGFSQPRIVMNPNLGNLPQNQVNRPFGMTANVSSRGGGAMGHGHFGRGRMMGRGGGRGRGRGRGGFQLRIPTDRLRMMLQQAEMNNHNAVAIGIPRRFHPHMNPNRPGVAPQAQQQQPAQPNEGEAQQREEGGQEEQQPNNNNQQQQQPQPQQQGNHFEIPPHNNNNINPNIVEQQRRLLQQPRRRRRPLRTVHDLIHLIVEKFHRYMHRATKLIKLKESLPLSFNLLFHELFEVVQVMNIMSTIFVMSLFYFIYLYHNVIFLLILMFPSQFLINYGIVNLVNNKKRYHEKKKNLFKRDAYLILLIVICLMMFDLYFENLHNLELIDILFAEPIHSPEDLRFVDGIWLGVFVDFLLKGVTFAMKLLYIILKGERKKVSGRVLAMIENVMLLYRMILPTVSIWVPMIVSRNGTLAFSFMIVGIVVIKFQTLYFQLLHVMGLFKIFNKKKYGVPVRMPKMMKKKVFKKKKEEEEEEEEEGELRRRGNEESSDNNNNVLEEEDDSEEEEEEEEELTEENRCSICYGGYKKPVRLEECTHIFCYDCIRRWFDNEKKYFCPVCRKDHGHIFASYMGREGSTFLLPIVI